MSALSKLSTMKRPRWPGGTGGAVGGAAGAGAGVWMATRGGSGRGTSVRGPTDSGGGVAGGGGAVATGGTTGGGGIGGVAVVRGLFDAEAHPLSRATATTATILRLTSLLRGIGRRCLRKAPQEIRGQRPTSRNDRHRRLTGLRHDNGRLPGHGRRLRCCGGGWLGGRRDHAGQRLVRHGLGAGLSRGGRGLPRRARLARI